MSAASGSLARHLEHTLLRPEASAADIERLCAEAREAAEAAGDGRLGTSASLAILAGA